MRSRSLLRIPTVLALPVICCLLIASCGGINQLNALSNEVNATCPPGTVKETNQSCAPIVSPPNPSPSPSVSPGPTTVDLSLTLGPVVDPTYGPVLGFELSTGGGEIIKVTANQPIQFYAFNDATAPHTAAYLGAATSTSAPWPASCASVAACVSTTASPANTVINTPGFTTGTLAAGQGSKIYKAPGPGFWMFGCHYHYDSNGMRTVIISM